MFQQQQQQQLIKTAMKWVCVNILILSTLFGWNFLEVTLRERIFWKNSRNTDSWGLVCTYTVVLYAHTAFNGKQQQHKVRK